MKTLTPKAEVFKALRDQGYPTGEAGRLAGYKNVHNNGGMYRVERLRKAGLLSPLVSLAKKAVKLTLQGQSVGSADPPKPSDIMRASEMVLDRAEPKVQKTESRSLSIGVTLEPEERARFLEGLGIPAIPQDVVPKALDNGEG